jgi:cell division initiation protein
MKLTALEIKQQKFEKALRGYEVNEVNAFLNMVASEYESLVAKQRDLERDLTQLKDKLKHYERVESALHETLQTAKDTAEQRLAGARQEAKSRLEKAEMEAESIVREANQQRHQVRQDIQRLLERRDDIIRGIRSYLDMASESLNIFSRDDSGQFILPGEDKPASASKPKSKPKSAEAPAPGAADLDAILDQIE